MHEGLETFHTLLNRTTSTHRSLCFSGYPSNGRVGEWALCSRLDSREEDNALPRDELILPAQPSTTGCVMLTPLAELKSLTPLFAWDCVQKYSHTLSGAARTDSLPQCQLCAAPGDRQGAQYPGEAELEQRQTPRWDLIAPPFRYRVLIWKPCFKLQA